MPSITTCRRCRTRYPQSTCGRRTTHCPPCRRVLAAQQQFEQWGSVDRDRARIVDVLSTVLPLMTTEMRPYVERFLEPLRIDFDEIAYELGELDEHVQRRGIAVMSRWYARHPRGLPIGCRVDPAAA